jgi:2-polyprenyl-3-methyl-5-hydroxy-6-metoxy-1,4-benzoquinol methylase
VSSRYSTCVQKTDIATPSRFGFGRNWRNFSEDIDENRIRTAERSLTTMLGADDLHGRSFLDVGCGSGLFSLAATRLGAERVRSFDYDPDSVATTEALRAKYAPEANWTIERGDATDRAYCESLGTFDVVYSWGVLHHTGAMWQAMENVTASVADGGVLFIAIYNDQGRKSNRWRIVKKLYNRLPALAQPPYVATVMLPYELRTIASALVRRRFRSYVADWTKGYERGMSRWHDMRDWVGGYPFEVAKPEEIFEFCRDHDFELLELKTAGGGLGNNQFVFRRRAAGVSAPLATP